MLIIKDNKEFTIAQNKQGVLYIKFKDNFNTNKWQVLTY